MKFRSRMACFLLVAVSINGYGQDRAGLSLTQLWERALANYPGIEAYRAQHRQAEIEEKLVRRQYLPDIHLQAQNTLGTQNAVSGAFFPLSGLYNVSSSGSENPAEHAANTFGSVVVDWKFLQFGKQKKLREVAEIATNESVRRLEAERLNVQSELSRTYFRLLFHQRMEEWAGKNTERLQSIFQASVSKARAGISPAADSLLVKATLSQTSADLHVWQGRRAEARIALATWLNTSGGELNVRDASFFSADSPPVIAREGSDGMPHPHLAFKQEQIALAEAQRRLSAVTALPSLSLLGGVQFRGNSKNKANSLYENWEGSYANYAHNYAVGLGLTWNIGGVFDSPLERRRDAEALRHREAEADEVALGLRSLAEAARQQMKQTLRQVANVEEAFESASRAYALFQARYDSGLISITELLQIEDVLQKAEKTRIDAYYQYWLQQVDLAESTADFSYLVAVFG